MKRRRFEGCKGITILFSIKIKAELKHQSEEYSKPNIDEMFWEIILQKKRLKINLANNVIFTKIQPTL